MAIENQADFIRGLGDDAGKWAEAFCKQFRGRELDEDEVFGWFANAIEHSYDVRTGNIINGEHAEYLIEKGDLSVQVGHTSDHG